MCWSPRVADGDRPAFSRSGTSSPFGKCDEPLQTWVPLEIKEKFTALALMKAGSSSEYLRDIVMEKVVGEYELIRLRATREKGSSGNSAE